jgi:small subunit ribosomal protein S6
MLIFDADLEEETIRSAVARYIQLIESRGAEPGPIDYWGKRRFAYELAHRWEGYYVVLQARSEPAAMEELHRVLSLADEVLRHKVLRIPEQVYGKLAGSAPPSSGGAPERQAGSAARDSGPVSEPEASDADDDTEGADADAAAADA